MLWLMRRQVRVSSIQHKLSFCMNTLRFPVAHISARTRQRKWTNRLVFKSWTDFCPIVAISYLVANTFEAFVMHGGNITWPPVSFILSYQKAGSLVLKKLCYLSPIFLVCCVLCLFIYYLFYFIVLPFHSLFEKSSIWSPDHGFTWKREINFCLS